MTGELGQWLTEVWSALNETPRISYVSLTNPNTSGITGLPGDILINVASASTWTRAWMMSGSVASIATSGWKMFRMA